MSPSNPISDNIEVNMHNGITMFQVGAYQPCIPLFEQTLRLDPLNYRTRYYLAMSYFRTCKYYAAVDVLNSMRDKNDPEARLACQLLVRAFLLREGNALDDVRMHTVDEAVELREMMKASPLVPEHFAHMLWHGKFGSDWHCIIDLSIILGPGGLHLCTLPWDQTPFDTETEYDWLPLWSCPMKVFDRDAAKHLFFQRTLQYIRDECYTPWPPMYSNSTFPSRQRQILLKRVYPDAPYTEIFDEL